VNAFARINVPFGGALTTLAELPKGARRILDDPFAVKRRPYEAYGAALVLVVLMAVWATGKVDEFLPEKARAATLLPRALSGPPAPPGKSP
jgi:ferric-dicitrate binding protein FerR (iron transport regulator)